MGLHRFCQIPVTRSLVNESRYAGVVPCMTMQPSKDAELGLSLGCMTMHAPVDEPEASMPSDRRAGI